MIRLCIFQAILICSMLAAFIGSASAGGVVMCVDDVGAVTYGDRACDGSTLANNGDASPVVRRDAAGTQVYVAAEQARAAVAARKRADKSVASRDIATLDAARRSMVLMDVAATESRQHKVAALELKDQSWFRF